MTLTHVLEWGIRSSILIVSGALLLWGLRLKDAAVRLLIWMVVLFGSLAIPVMIVGLPRLPVTITRVVAAPAVPPVVPESAVAGGDTIEPAAAGLITATTDGARPVVWSQFGVALYASIGTVLLVRLLIGLVLSHRLLRASRPTGRAADGIEIRESDDVAAPVALGVYRAAIVLPSDWEAWPPAKLDAVVAHERSHVRRRDPLLQVCSAVHRALLWYSPFSWFLHTRIVRTAEDLSDDAAVAAVGDRAVYAEMLLEFMQRGTRAVVGVPMARYDRPEARLHRILDGTTTTPGVTRWAIAAIVALGVSGAYLVAATSPRTVTERAPSPPLAAPLPTSGPAAAPAPSPTRSEPPQGASRVVSEVSAPSSTQTPTPSSPRFLRALGAVSPFYSVVVRAAVDGQLVAVTFKEGDFVRAGQVLASIDPRPYQIQVELAQAHIDSDKEQLQEAGPPGVGNGLVSPLQARLKGDLIALESANLQLSHAEVTAPIAGVTGFRLVDPGNVVHGGDGLLVIDQFDPITVVFNVQQDRLPEVRARLNTGATVSVEAWTRDNTARIATGTLTAVDNQIDEQTGMVKLKAVFDNKDGALFPNQFVNVRVLGVE